MNTFGTSITCCKSQVVRVVSSGSENANTDFDELSEFADAPKLVMGLLESRETSNKHLQVLFDKKS